MFFVRFAISPVMRKLRDGERTELYFEGDEPTDGRLDRGGDLSFAFVFGDGLGDLFQHAEQERAGADGRVGNSDAGRRQPGRLIETGLERFVNERVIEVTTSGGV